MTKKIKFSSVIKILKRIKLRTLILLIILLSFNSYAWFIYANKVSGGLNAHISSWNVEFRAGESEVTTEITFDVDRIYPGMPTSTKTLTAYNKGEMLAELLYQINSIRILNNTYTVSEDLTQEALLETIRQNYPFKLSFIIDNTNLYAINGSADFIASLSWDFESGNDAKDTQWGELAYAYNKENPDSSSIHIELSVSAVQKNSDTE